MYDVNRMKKKKLIDDIDITFKFDNRSVHYYINTNYIELDLFNVSLL